MDVFLIRTRLQALIAGRLVGEGLAARRYGVVFIYRQDTDEGAASVRDAYLALERDARFSLRIASNRSFAGTTGVFLVMFLLASLSRGRVFFAGVDSYPTAIAARLAPFAKFSTFDDGSANAFQDSKYYSDQPLEGRGLKRQLSRLLFSQGSASWLRKRVQAHYTILPGLPNIVEPGRLTTLAWDWRDHLVAEDLPKLPSGGQSLTVTLGIAGDRREKLPALLERSDLYILHPREADWSASPKMVRLGSPAEAVLLFLSERRTVTVYHFNSTVNYTLAGRPNIRFINVLEPAA